MAGTSHFVEAEIFISGKSNGKKSSPLSAMIGVTHHHFRWDIRKPITGIMSNDVPIYIDGEYFNTATLWGPEAVLEHGDQILVNIQIDWRAISAE